MKKGCNKERYCSLCKFFRVGSHDFGESSGYCVLKRYLNELLKSFDIPYDDHFDDAGIFGQCDLLDYFNVNEKK